jgi:hypothetical protein
MATADRAALYLRVSTGRQADNDLSIPDQRRQANAYCASRGWEIVADYVEPGASATDGRRPEFQRMIDAATTKPPAFDVILVHSFSRFFPISARNSSRINTPGRGSNQRPDPVRPQGAHSNIASNIDPLRRGLGNRRFIPLSYGTANPRRTEPSALGSFADKARQGPPYVAGVCHDNGTRPLRSPRADRPLPRRRPNLTIPLFLRESTADWPPSNEPTADASGMAWSGRAGPA